MSIPRTNLEDLKRRPRSVTPLVSTQSHSRDAASGTTVKKVFSFGRCYYVNITLFPQDFKFKSSIGPSQPTAKSGKSVGFVFSDFCTNGLTIVTKEPSSSNGYLSSYKPVSKAGSFSMSPHNGAQPTETKSTPDTILPNSPPIIPTKRFNPCMEVPTEKSPKRHKGEQFEKENLDVSGRYLLLVKVAYLLNIYARIFHLM